MHFFGSRPVRGVHPAASKRLTRRARRAVQTFLLTATQRADKICQSYQRAVKNGNQMDDGLWTKEGSLGLPSILETTALFT